MAILGLTGFGHDASAAVIEEDGEIRFAGHAERYSRVKNDPALNWDLIEEANLSASGWDDPEIDRIVWYERPLLKKLRYAVAGQWDALRKAESVRKLLRPYYLDGYPITFVGHHESHAAGGYFTSGFYEAAVLVCDAIGELDTISVWVGRGDHLRKVWSQGYPHSLGLLYSAFTQRIGLKPNEEEYILMGMAALGQPNLVEDIRRDFIEDAPAPHFRLKENVHRGVRSWRPDLTPDRFPDIAASIQYLAEEYLCEMARWIADQTKLPNLVLAGGVALNCVANTKIVETGAFEHVWIMPNPGDAGSAVGAVAAYLRKPLKWRTPYLGHKIARKLDVRGAISCLLDGEVIGIANGRAEFGPRALGNRSLICDPRGPDVKDRVNQIKMREPFRPFAPIVLEHLADRYFDMPVRRSPYMQFVARVKNPEAFPAITHFDGTARVQTLSQDQNPVFYDLLSKWHTITGCPMLLNTSLNVKGEPLVNTWEDALRFQEHYGVQVF